MPTPRSPAIDPALNAAAVAGRLQQRAHGHRAVISFSPKPGGGERLCAGVVTRLQDGTVAMVCAVDERKAQHAFGPAGLALHHAALALCQSLAEHWRTDPAATGWTPPFESARLEEVTPFSARTADDGARLMLARSSSLHTLLSAYDIEQTTRNRNIVEQVQSVIRRDNNAKHLGKRFNREIHVGDDAGNLRVDFLGQNFACYFLQITRSPRGIEATAERAFGRLYELQALRKFVRKPRKSLGLLEDERPKHFELVMVGEAGHPVQRKVINMVIGLADRDDISAKPVDSANAAAEHVARMERLAA